ncbi:hypothetical protein JHW43_003211 [Diplocarpon mali]|nr:hypothetical protein JHW43_003211 [Diplocarpon mali]
MCRCSRRLDRVPPPPSPPRRSSRPEAGRRDAGGAEDGTNVNTNMRDAGVGAYWSASRPPSGASKPKDDSRAEDQNSICLTPDLPASASTSPPPRYRPCQAKEKKRVVVATAVVRGLRLKGGGLFTSLPASPGLQVLGEEALGELVTAGLGEEKFRLPINNQYRQPNGPLGSGTSSRRLHGNVIDSSRDRRGLPEYFEAPSRLPDVHGRRSRHLAYPFLHFGITLSRERTRSTPPHHQRQRSTGIRRAFDGRTQDRQEGLATAGARHPARRDRVQAELAWTAFGTAMLERVAAHGGLRLGGGLQVLAAGADSGTCADEVTFSGADTGDGGPEAGASVPADSGGLIGARPLTREPLALEKAAPAPDQFSMGGKGRRARRNSSLNRAEAKIEARMSGATRALSRPFSTTCPPSSGQQSYDGERARTRQTNGRASLSSERERESKKTGGEFAAPEVVRKRKVVEAKQPELVEGRMEGCRGLLDLPSPVSVADGTFPSHPGGRSSWDEAVIGGERGGRVGPASRAGKGRRWIRRPRVAPAPALMWGIPVSPPVMQPHRALAASALVPTPVVRARSPTSTASVRKISGPRVRILALRPPPHRPAPLASHTIPTEVSSATSHATRCLVTWQGSPSSRTAAMDLPNITPRCGDAVRSRSFPSPSGSPDSTPPRPAPLL